jgi:hypothetical protein
MNDETPPVQPAPTPAYAAAPPPKRNRGRVLLAGGALGIALVAGSAGFALGHVTADDGRDGAGRFGFQRNGGPGGFPGNGPQQQQPPGFPDGPDGPDDPDESDGSGPLPD